MRRGQALFLLVGMCAAPAMAHGALSERIAILGDQVKAHPQDAALRVERAELLRQDEAFDAALAELSAAEKLDAKAADHPVLRAQVLMDAKRFAQAAQAVEAFANSHPKHGPAWWLLGLARLRAGEGAGASAALDRAVALMDPLQPDHVLAQAQAHALAKRPKDALARLDAGIAKLGALPALVEQALALELELGQKEAARRRLDRVEAQWRARGLKTERWQPWREKTGR